MLLGAANLHRAVASNLGAGRNRTTLSVSASAVPRPLHENKTQAQRIVEATDAAFQEFARECVSDAEVQEAAAYFHRSVVNEVENCELEHEQGDHAECRGLHTLEQLALAHMAEAAELDADGFEGLIAACRALDHLEARRRASGNASTSSAATPSVFDYGCEVDWSKSPAMAQACLQSVFQSLDGDGDGRVDRDELQLGLELLLGNTLTDQDMLVISSAIIDNKLKLSFDEFASLAQEVVPSLRTRAAATGTTGRAAGSDANFLRHAVHGHVAPKDQHTGSSA